jgi:hypothetical protein
MSLLTLTKEFEMKSEARIKEEFRPTKHSVTLEGSKDTIVAVEHDGKICVTIHYYGHEWDFGKVAKVLKEEGGFDHREIERIHEEMESIVHERVIRDLIVK